jgi:alpha-beta hydrolase superfamily lysophospholipase
LHGDADKTVPLQASRNFQAKLRANGVPCELMIIPGAGHGLLNWEKFAPDYAARMVQWLRAMLDQAANASAIPMTSPAPAAPHPLSHHDSPSSPSAFPVSGSPHDE